jgi:hypothetical protein
MADLNFLLDIARLAATGLVAGAFTAFVATKDHRFKKWWELRVGAYQTVIEALSDLVYAYDIRYRAEIEYRTLPEERKMELSSTVQQAYARVRKAADAGAFLFSDQANSALQLFRAEWEKDYDMYVDHLDAVQAAAKRCLQEIVGQSKVDLRLQATFMVWK